MTDYMECTSQRVPEGTWPAALRAIIVVPYNATTDDSRHGTAPRAIIQFVAKIDNTSMGATITRHITVDPGNMDELGGLMAAMGHDPSRILSEMIGKTCLIRTQPNFNGTNRVIGWDPLPNEGEPVLLDDKDLVCQDMSSGVAVGYGEAWRLDLPPRSRERLMYANSK